MKTKIILFYTFLSFLFCTAINTVKVYDMEFRYKFIFVWAREFDIRSFEFYVVPFLANFLMCLLLLIFVFKNVNIKPLLERRLFFIAFIFINLSWLFLVIINPLVFGLDIYAYETKNDDTLHPQQNHLYCEYFRFTPPKPTSNIEYEICGRVYY